MMEDITTLKQMFPDESVYVVVPPQAKAVKVVKHPIPTDLPMKSPEGEFQPMRAVINLRVVEADRPDNDVLKFDPPIEVRVRYSEEEYKSEYGLGFYDGEHWIRFTQQKHHFKLVPADPPSEGGWGIVLISHWGDPTIGMGR